MKRHLKEVLQSIAKGQRGMRLCSPGPKSIDTGLAVQYTLSQCSGCTLNCREILLILEVSVQCTIVHEVPLEAKTRRGRIEA